MAAVPLSTSIPSDLDAELRAAAARTGIPIARLVQQGIRLRLDQLSPAHDALARELYQLGPVTFRGIGAARALLTRLDTIAHPLAYALLSGAIDALLDAARLARERKSATRKALGSPRKEVR